MDVVADANSTTRCLGARFRLSRTQLDQLSMVLASLAADELAPTTVREPAAAVDAHLADSLVALELEVVRGARRIADIGAGAGFPGLPLAIALPESQVKLVESQARKCAFVERVAGRAGIENAEVMCARTEEWPEGIEAHDVVLARAVAPQPVVLEYAAPLLRVGGALVDWRGRRNGDEERAAVEAAELLGLERQLIVRVQPWEGARNRHLHVFSKLRATPDRFPRRVGMARKKPLVT
jgi:16S rRNA (guanine527-N7)-methyltransferase